jgi:hypothetical protein
MTKNIKKLFVDDRRHEHKLLLDSLYRILAPSMKFTVRCLNTLQENIHMSNLV